MGHSLEYEKFTIFFGCAELSTWIERAECCAYDCNVNRET